MIRTLSAALLVASLLSGLARPVAGAAGQEVQRKAPAAKAVTFRGLDMTVVAVDRAQVAALQDCPPGENTQRGMAKPGEQFAIVSVRFAIRPDFTPIKLDRPTARDAAGNTYYTAVAFVDLGKVPEFTCAFPFRVPTGTSLTSLHIGDATLDLTAFGSKTP